MAKHLFFAEAVAVVEVVSEGGELPHGMSLNSSSIVTPRSTRDC